MKPGMRGDYLNRSALRRRFKTAQARAGLRPLRFHDLRHTFGSLAARTTTERELQEWLGHADAKTTARYTHYRPRGGEAARLAPAFAVADPASAVQANGLQEPSADVHPSTPGEEGFPAQAAFARQPVEHAGRP